VPSGYEIYEKHYGQVFLRKKQPQIISDDELECVKKEISKHKHLLYTYVEVVKNNIVIYGAEIEVLEELEDFLMKSPYVKKDDIDLGRFAHYSEKMRFELVDKEKRLFRPFRFCVRGGCDEWIDIDVPDLLKRHVTKYVDKIGTMSFFEIMPVWLLPKGVEP
jgi:hypothetical protein